MRWKLLRRRLSVSAPRMIVRSRLAWPLRGIGAALLLGFSAALGLWAFEFGKSIAGLDRGAQAELAQLRLDVARLGSEREQALSVANTADSLLKAERAAQEKLASQIKQVEAENLSLKSDLGFFERLLPTAAGDGVSIRSLQAEAVSPGRLRLQLLVMQAGRSLPEFSGRCEVALAGTLDGKPWSFVPAPNSQPVQIKQYLRLDRIVEHPPQAVVTTVQVRVLDAAGAVKATQAVKV